MNRNVLAGAMAALFLVAIPSPANADLCKDLVRQRKDPTIIKACQAAQEAERALERLRRFRMILQETADTMAKAREAVEYRAVRRSPPSSEKPWEHIPSHPSEVERMR